MKEGEFARPFTCKVVVRFYCRLGIRPPFPLGVISFIVYLHVNSRANSLSFILAVFEVSFPKNSENENSEFAREFTCNYAMKEMTTRETEEAGKDAKTAGQRVCT